jgi:hypothetical protein
MVLGANALTVEPHLPAAQELVNVTFRHIFQALYQEIVDTLALAVLTYDFRDRSTQWNFFA